MKNPILILALLFSASIAFAQRSIGDHSNKKIEAETANWSTVKQSVCSMKYPNNWELDESGGQGTSFMVFSPLANSGDSFRDNMNLLIQNLSSYNLDLDTYTELSIKQIEDAGFEMIGSKRLKNGCHEIAYTGTVEGYQLQWKQHYWVRNNHAYVLTFTAEQIEYEAFEKQADAMFSSFRLK
ncbi:MAG: hypothetical protein GY810_31940 [Aureispira sp.]|nr:hypothetical protein [Aureispira sp.]